MIHFIGGEKGGVGKSVISRLLAQYFIDKRIPFTGYDTDRSHQTFLRFYGDFASPTVIDSYEHLDGLVENHNPENPKRVIVDLAAQTNFALQNWIEESNVIELSQEISLKLRFWHVMDDSKDSVLLLDSLLRKFQNNVEYVIVLNHGRGNGFRIFESSPTKELAMEYNVPIFNLKKLHEKSMQKIDEMNTSFWGAINGGNPQIGILEKQRVKSWINSVYSEFDRLLV